MWLFCIPIYEIYVAFFSLTRLYTLLAFFLLAAFSLAPFFFALFAQNNNLYEMSREKENKALGVNIPKQNCLKTAFDMRDSCCCLELNGGI